MQKKSAIEIEWFDGRLFGWWCYRCRKMTKVQELNGELRCCQCTSKMAEELDAEYVQLLRENGQLQ